MYGVDEVAADVVVAAADVVVVVAAAVGDDFRNIAPLHLIRNKLHWWYLLRRGLYFVVDCRDVVASLGQCLDMHYHPSYHSRLHLNG